MAVNPAGARSFQRRASSVTRDHPPHLRGWRTESDPDADLALAQTHVAIGVAIGLVIAIGVTRFLRSLLYDVSPTDPVILVGTCAALLLVALAASWIPAQRAAAVDPSEALRGG